jgi:hypothetical protein
MNVTGSITSHFGFNMKNSTTTIFNILPQLPVVGAATPVVMGMPDPIDTDLIISGGSNLNLYAGGDIIADIGGSDFRMNKSDTEFFRFNLDTDPKIDATGDIIIDPSGGDMHLHGSDLTVTGSINASGDINGTIDGGTF